MAKYIGFHKDEDLPIKPGQTVTIPKGTQVKSTNPSHKSYAAGRTMKVKVHHLMNGSNWRKYNHETEETETIYSNPGVRWVGTGGYWCDADINDIPEAQSIP